MRTRFFDDSQRGQGFTTLQMKRAPLGALYIMPTSGSLDHARGLALFLGREDLKIVCGSILDRHAEALRGCRFSAIVLDHAAEPERDEWELLRELRATIVKR